MSAFLRCFVCAALGVLLFSTLGDAQPIGAVTNSAPKTGAPTTPDDASKKMMAAAIERMNANDADGARAKLTEAIRLNPNNSGAYVLRAAIYCQKKMWNEAEADFVAAQKLAPTNTALKFNVIEVKFMQKQYDAARPGYLALENDPDMGDFASYKVFLCDLAAGHLDVAAQELAAFEKSNNASYYFGNAAWSISKKNYDDARSWLESAAHIFPPRKNAYYAEGLIYLGYLPLPHTTPSNTVIPPSVTAPGQ
jgi:Tfp pilus assembly protein PilF